MLGLSRVVRLTVLLYLCLVLGSGCRLVPPANHADPDMYYMPERQGEPGSQAIFSGEPTAAKASYYGTSEPYLRYVMPLAPVPARDPVPDSAQSCCVSQYLSHMPLSPGDRVRIRILDGDLFNGDYEVNIDGTLQLPFLTPIPVAGMSIAAAERHLEQALVSQGYFLPHIVEVSVRHLMWGAIQVHISGAVFQPGLHVINRRDPDDRAQHMAQSGGDYAPDRTLTAALRAAGGVRPDANIRHVTLIRAHQQWDVDLTGAIFGEFVTDPPLAAGDRIVVQSTGMFQPNLVRPSMITPPGIRVYMSNLTVPADSNALSNINADATKFPYGTRLLQAMVAANCVGGTDATNANRHVVLASYNPLSGHSEVIERSVEGLIRRANRDDYNPYLLPGDALACYDSVVTGIRDVARTISDVLGPLRILDKVPK